METGIIPLRYWIAPNDSVIRKISPVFVFVPQAPSGAGVPAAGDIFYNGKGMGPWRGMTSLSRR